MKVELKDSPEQILQNIVDYSGYRDKYPEIPKDVSTGFGTVKYTMREKPPKYYPTKEFAGNLISYTLLGCIVGNKIKLKESQYVVRAVPIKPNSGPNRQRLAQGLRYMNNLVEVGVFHLAFYLKTGNCRISQSGHSRYLTHAKSGNFVNRQLCNYLLGLRKNLDWMKADGCSWSPHFSSNYKECSSLREYLESILPEDVDLDISPLLSKYTDPGICVNLVLEAILWENSNHALNVFVRKGGRYPYPMGKHLQDIKAICALNNIKVPMPSTEEELEETWDSLVTEYAPDYKAEIVRRLLLSDSSHNHMRYSTYCRESLRLPVQEVDSGPLGREVAEVNLPF